MFLESYQNIPLGIDPVAFSIGEISIRWYAVSYLIGFFVVFFILLWRIREGEADNVFPFSKQKKGSSVVSYKSLVVQDFLLVSFFCALVGGRVGYVIFYDLSYFLTNPLRIISPFSQSRELVGIFGMSYHGALLGVIVGSLIFLKRKKINFFSWADFVVPAVSLGYFFGRIGNFLNGELHGRATNSFFGMYFSVDPSNLRHPSQLYEAFFEGLLLFAVLWKLRNSSWQKIKKPGFLFAAYLMGYGFSRIFVEQFREPDSQIGFLFGFLTLGQLLSCFMIVSGLVIFAGCFKKDKKML